VALGRHRRGHVPPCRHRPVRHHDRQRQPVRRPLRRPGLLRGRRRRERPRAVAKRRHPGRDDAGPGHQPRGSSLHADAVRRVPGRLVLLGRYHDRRPRAVAKRRHRGEDGAVRRPRAGSGRLEPPAPAGRRRPPLLPGRGRRVAQRRHAARGPTVSRTAPPCTRPPRWAASSCSPPTTSSRG
jgi:hypothetical protein